MDLILLRPNESGFDRHSDPVNLVDSMPTNVESQTWKRPESGTQCTTAVVHCMTLSRTLYDTVTSMSSLVEDSSHVELETYRQFVDDARALDPPFRSQRLSNDHIDLSTTVANVTQFDFGRLLRD